MLLTRLILLSLAAALATIALKTVAWRLTGSVGLFSDAVESVVNFVAAAGALVAIRWATRPPDSEHMYGHEKAEYFAAAAEGLMIIGAAASIAWVAVGRLVHPAGIEDVGVGLTVSAAASLINLGVGVALIRFGRRYRSIALEADGKHLMTDVWTSVGVIVGVSTVALTGWRVLDPVVALAVAGNIVLTGISLIRRSGGGLMDRVLPDAERAAIDQALAPFAAEVSAFTLCAHAAPAAAPLSPCMSSFRANGASKRAIACSSDLSMTCARRCPAPACSRTSSPPTTRLRSTTSSSTAGRR